MRITSCIIAALILTASACINDHTSDSGSIPNENQKFSPPLNNQRMRLFDSGWKFATGDFEGAEEPGFNDKNWQCVDLPHDWSIEDLPGQKENEVIGPFDSKSIGVFYTGYTVGGTGWYRKKFIVDESDKDKEITIYFDGVYMVAEVWINGRRLGIHHHGYTPFYFSLNRYLEKTGRENTVAVLVRNEGENSRWYSGSGIYRHVWLRVTEPINIPEWSLNITTPQVSEEKAIVSVKLTVVNNKSVHEEFTVRNTIYDPEGRKKVTTGIVTTTSPGEKKEIHQTLAIERPSPWSDETPSLYLLRTEILRHGEVIDYMETPFGIRSISFSPDKGFLLNGKKIVLHGACIHHDNGALGSAAFDRAEQRKIWLLKQAGFNAVRTSHNPPSQGFLDACDKMGMLVLDEAFDMWEQPKRKDDYNLYFREHHKEDLQSMILRDRNHPSVIMWSIGNEIRERADTSGLRIARELIGTIKDLDSTRPVTMAICEFWETKGRKWDDSAPAFGQLDVCGYNYKYGEYEKDHNRFPERIMAGTESFAMDIYQNWKMSTGKPYVIGDFVWTGMDYLGEAGIGQTMTDSTTMCWPWIISNCGDLDIMGFKKPQAYYRDVVWDRSPVEMAVEELPPAGKTWLIRAWGWPREYRCWTWPGNEGKIMNVRVYSKCTEVALFLNESLISKQKNDSTGRFTFNFKTIYKPGTLKAVVYSDGKEVASQKLETAGPTASIFISPDRNRISCNRNDLAYIAIELHDANGRLVPWESSLVKLRVEGAADLIGVDNGDPRSPRSFKTNWCKTYNGRCIAILRPEGRKGEVIFTASTENQVPVSCRIGID
jgi:beta-galactosidase